MVDPISDLITRLKTGGRARKESISLPASKLKVAIAKVLVAEGYLKSAAVDKKSGRNLEIDLAYENGESKIKDIERVSKTSRRVYQGFAEIHPPRGNAGRAILSTPKGIFTDRQAIKEKVGGEILFRIW